MGSRATSRIRIPWRPYNINNQRVYQDKEKNNYCIPPRPGSYARPFSAAIPRALAIASAMLTDPASAGLAPARFKLPVLSGGGSP